MATINVRRVRDAFVKAEVADEAPALELAVTLDEELEQGGVSTRSDLAAMEERIQRRFAEADAQAERRMVRFLLAVIASQAVFTGIVGILIAVL